MKTMKTMKRCGIAAVMAVAALFMQGCGGSNNGAELGIPVIDVEQALDNEQEVMLSKYFSKIEYVPLETTQEALVTDVSMVEIYPDDDRVYIRNIEKLGAAKFLSFDYTGKNLKFNAISGRAKGEYTNGFNLLPGEDCLYMVDMLSILKYDKDGNYLSSIQLEGGEGMLTAMNIALLNGELVYLYREMNNQLTEEENLICIRDSEGNKRAVHSLGKVEYITRMKDVGYGPVPVVSPRYNPMVCWSSDKAFLLGYTDTIFSINQKDGALVKEYLLSTGKYRKDDDEGVSIRRLFYDTPQFIFYQVIIPPAVIPNIGPGGRNVFCLYDKATGKGVKLPFYEEYTVDNQPYKGRGFQNDLDGGMIFLPSKIRGNKMYQLVNAYKFIEYAESTGSKAMQEVAAKLNEESNPVLVIATLK